MEPSNSNSQFSEDSNDEIDKTGEGITLRNARSKEAFVWKQFREFCVQFAISLIIKFPDFLFFVLLR
jgi:hypothetical protein